MLSGVRGLPKPGESVLSRAFVSQSHLDAGERNCFSFFFFARDRATFICRSTLMGASYTFSDLAIHPKRYVPVGRADP